MDKFQEEGFASPKLIDWLDWVSGKSSRYFIALPMIQRGSVWKPAQIIALWDSLLRGMPIGSLMLNEIRRGRDGNPVKVRRLGESSLVEAPESGCFGLIDGQQRTLAMLVGWLPATDPRTVKTLWVDFADKPAPEHLFRMHITTSAHPYGFRKSDPNSRLSLDDRRNARKELGSSSAPWESHLPLRLETLIEAYRSVSCDKDKWMATVKNRLLDLTHRGKGWADYSELMAAVDMRLERFADSLQRLFDLRVPLIRIPAESFENCESETGDDPALAILFKRIGGGGTSLSDADYIYSVIKHHLPETFQLVEDVSTSSDLARLLGPTDIVMTTVRLIAAELDLQDYESPSKSDFDRLRTSKQFLERFLQAVSSGRIGKSFSVLSILLRYRESHHAADPGLPPQGFILIKRPVLQVILRWLLMQPGFEEKTVEELLASAEASREELLRYCLYSELALADQHRASQWAYSWLQRSTKAPHSKFPGRELVAHLLERGAADGREVAWALPSVKQFRALVVCSRTDDRPLLGWERFHLDAEDAERDPQRRQALNVCRRWWGQGGHQHPFLLWLQRSYLQRWEQTLSDSWSADETAYDYDHICPSAHWQGWHGTSYTGDRLIDFLATARNGGHWHVGNAIGNLRVWDASDNRSLGDSSAEEKLNLFEADESSLLLADSAIRPRQVTLWRACSYANSGSKWQLERVIAFQRAVEERTCDLYEDFFLGLQFDTWFPDSI